MKHPFLFAILVLVVCTMAVPNAGQNNVPPEVREMARKVMMPVVYKVPGMDKVKVVQNVKYTSRDDPNVLMDFYLPPDTSQTEKRPAVIFIHGGVKTQYTPKNWGLYTTWGRLIAASGFNDLLGFWMRGVAEDTQPFFNASTDTPQPRPTPGSLTPSNC